MKFITNSPAETAKIGEKIGKELLGHDVIALEGDLGGGKTQFAKGLAKGLGVKDEVVSPTFTIERIYNGKNLNFHHYDFYRLLEPDPEIEERIYDLLDEGNVLAIEWSNNLAHLLPDSYLEVKFEYKGDDKREIELVAHGQKYQDIIKGLK